MPPRRALALLCALLLWPVATRAEEVGRIVYFGDSLTDCCILGPFTDARAPNWSDRLPPLIGAEYAASPEQNRAIGGAQSDRRNVTPLFERRTGERTGLLDQVARYLAEAPAIGADDLAAIWIGANDIHPSARPADAVGRLRQPLGPQPPAAALARFTTGNVRSALEALRGAGFRRFLLLSPFDIADADMTPEPGADALASAYSVAIRDGLAALSLPGADIRFLDMLALLDEVQAAPERHGFEHVTGEMRCPKPCATLPRAARRKFVFVDAIHLSAAFHELVAARAADILAAPSRAR